MKSAIRVKFTLAAPDDGDGIAVECDVVLPRSQYGLPDVEVVRWHYDTGERPEWQDAATLPTWADEDHRLRDEAWLAACESGGAPRVDPPDVQRADYLLGMREGK